MLLQFLIQKRSQSLSHPLPPLSIEIGSLSSKSLLTLPWIYVQWFAHQQRQVWSCKNCSILWRLRLDPDLHIVALSLRWSRSYTHPKQPDQKESNSCALMQWFCWWQVISDTTGWSKETVDCNFLLTDPKISKSVKTQWFLGSLHREVLVFWCLKNARCVEFCLFGDFPIQSKLHQKWPEHSDAPSEEPKP